MPKRNGWRHAWHGYDVNIMGKVERLEDVLRKYPNFKPMWRHLVTEMPEGIFLVTGLENPKYGKVERVVVCKDDGTPLFDQYQIEEGPADEQGRRPYSSGSVIVPYFQQDTVYVGLLNRIRELVIDPKTGKQGSTIALELPRGFAKLAESHEDTAIRELGEETSKVAKKLVKLGRVNPNTAFYVTPGVPIFAAEVDPIVTNYLKHDQREPILKCSFIPYKDVRRKIYNKEIYDGWTLSGLAMFDVYLESLHK